MLNNCFKFELVGNPNPNEYWANSMDPKFSLEPLPDFHMNPPRYILVYKYIQYNRASISLFLQKVQKCIYMPGWHRCSSRLQSSCVRKTCSRSLNCIVLYLPISIAPLTAGAFQKRSRPQCSIDRVSEFTRTTDN